MNEVNEFLNSPHEGHWDAVIHILKYIKGALGKGLLYEDKGYIWIVGYVDVLCHYIFIGDNPISWKSKD